MTRFSVAALGSALAVLACRGESDAPAERHLHEHPTGGSANGGEAATGGTTGAGSTSGGGTGSGGSEGGTSGSSPTEGGATARGGSPAGGESNEGGAGADPGPGGEGGADPVEPPLVNGCVSYADRTAEAAVRTLSWDFGIVDSPERCLKILAGQSVTFSGDFEIHPLDISPVVPGSLGEAGDAYTATFPNEGALGWVCQTHSEMNGGIWVVTPSN